VARAKDNFFYWRKANEISTTYYRAQGVVDMDLFYASTFISLGNGKIASFWDSPWLNDTKPKYIAPLIYEASTRKRWKVNQALTDHAWVKKNQDGHKPHHPTFA
jgi:hypothetical protein